MTYSEFNYRVFDFYIERSGTGYTFLSIDQKDMSDILKDDELPFFDELQWDWEPLLNGIDNIPQFFGLIAIQCYAASVMESDRGHSADDYKGRLAELLEVHVDYIQGLFAKGGAHNAVQDRIWQSARIFFEELTGQQMSIPDPTINAYRYTRYPLSQSLLNSDDLKRFTLFFQQEFEFDEHIPYAFFKRRLLETMQNIIRSRRCNELMKKEETAERCLEQIYHFFNAWDGDVFDPAVSKVTQSSRFKVPRNNQDLLLLFEEGIPGFFVDDTKTGTMPREISVTNFFSLAEKLHRETGLVFLNPIEDFYEEYEASRFFYSEQGCYILADKRRPSPGQLFFERHALPKILLEESFVLYRYEPGTIHPPVFLTRHMRPRKEVMLSGGIRLSRTREYMKGFGPTISGATEFYVLHNNRKCNYKTASAPGGDYAVRIPGFRDYRFRIVENLNSMSVVASQSYGWKLDSYVPAMDPDVEGCLFKTMSMPRPTVNINREWIKINTGNKTGAKHALIRMLNNARV